MGRLGLAILLTQLASVIYGTSQYDSFIEFTASPTVITPASGENLTLLCQLNETPAGRPLIGGQSVTSGTRTSESIDRVTSIVIFRENRQVVASLNEGDYIPLRTTETEIVAVTGDLNASPRGVRGYLRVVILQPSYSTAGNFLCQLSALTMATHTVFPSSSLTVDFGTPTVEDLVIRLNKMEQQKNQKMRVLERENQQMMQEIRETKDKLNHTQTGKFDCTSPELRDASSSTRLIYRTKAFPRPYSHAPTLFVSVAGVKGYLRRDDTFHYVFVTSVNRTHFTVRCTAWGHSQVSELMVNWLSLAK